MIMLRSADDLMGFRILATDDKIGSVHDFYFDDTAWQIRYLVADTGGWLAGRRVLLSPKALGKPDWEGGVFPVHLTREQVENSPGIETEKTVSRQYETDLHHYYGWPVYWGEVGYAVPGAVANPAAVPEATNRTEVEEKPGGHNLRGMREVKGYDIRASDGEIGTVKDFIVDDETWQVRYLVIDTGNWLPGKKVLLAPEWVHMIKWSERNVHVEMDQEHIKNAPEFDTSEPVSREYENRLHDHYGRTKYWAS
jgi:uncharacterized protein YrrD